MAKSDSKPDPKEISVKLPDPVEDLLRIWLFLYSRDGQRRPAAVALISEALYGRANEMDAALERHAKDRGMSVSELKKEIGVRVDDRS